MLSNLKNLCDKVDFILDSYPGTRDSDQRLIYRVYELFYGVKENHSFKDVMARVHKKELPCFESIRRVRQKIQESGRFVGKNKKVRGDLEPVVRDQIQHWERS